MEENLDLETEQYSEVESWIESVDWNLVIDILESIERYAMYQLGVSTFIAAILLFILFALSSKKE